VTTGVFFHPEARDEALAAATFYESHHAGLGRRFLDPLAAVISRIETHPAMYPEIEPEFARHGAPRSLTV
jgi:hypothetical protein